MRWLTVHALGREFGLDALRVSELAPCHGVTRVPGSARALRGLTGLRGQPIPVLDLALRLGGSAVAVGSRTPLVILTARVDGDPIDVAFLVDGAGRLVDVGEPLRSRELQALAPEGVCIGFADVEGALVPLLDIDALVARDRLDEMAGTRMLPAGGSCRRGGRRREAGNLERTGAVVSAVKEERREPSSGATHEAEARRQEPDASVAPTHAEVATTSPPTRPSGRAAEHASERAPAREHGQERRPPRQIVPSGAPGFATSARSPMAPVAHRVAGEAGRSVRLPASPEPPIRKSTLGWLGAATVSVLALAVAILLALGISGSKPVGSKRAPERLLSIAQPPVPAPPRDAQPEPVPKPPPKAEPGAAAKAAPSIEALPCEIHEIRSGDTLWAIARRYLNDPFRWPEIHRRNRDVIEDPDVISPHVRLRVTGSCGAGEPGGAPGSKPR